MRLGKLYTNLFVGAVASIITIGVGPVGMGAAIAWDAIDAAILVSSDDPAELNSANAGGRIARYMAALQPQSASGIKILGVINGETRVDQPGHEHFGFKDGVSQPGVRGSWIATGNSPCSSQRSR